jgi:hypothetical protein
MPVFEEKLICPFSVRFTQENIRTTFQDGRALQDSLAQIKTQKGDGKNYDLILCAPFPAIEIIRWSGGSRSYSCGEQWFTFDNRRLFCLQRAAAAYWPARVAAVVEVLYKADKGSWSKKCDTTTDGTSVNLRLCGVCQDQSIGRWDWQATVKRIATEAAQRGTVTLDYVNAAQAVSTDCSKRSVDELLEAPAAPDSMSLLTMAATMSTSQTQQDSVNSESGSENGKQSNGGYAKVAATPSTGVSEDPSASEGSSPRFDDLPEAASTEGPETGESQETPKDYLATLLNKVWLGRQGETYKFEDYDDTSWSCIKSSQGSQRKYNVTYDRDTGCLWWGSDYSFFLDPAELQLQPEQVAWYTGKDFGKQKLKPRFTWQQAQSATTSNQKKALTSSNDPTEGCNVQAQPGNQKKWTPKLKSSRR